MSKILSSAIIRMLEQERFYAELVLQMDRIVGQQVKTAAVSIKQRVRLYVNPTFFATLSLDEQVAVLKHECAHILNNHIPRMKELHPEVYAKDKDVADSIINGTKHRVLNIAADCAINPAIPHIPENGMFPKKFNLPDGELFEWYAEKLKDNEELKNLNEFDDHSMWAESEGDKEELRQKILNAINKAASNTRAAGRMTSENELLVDRLNYKPKDWKSEIRRFVSRSQNTKVEESRKKRNRRYGIQYPGIIKEEVLHLGVALDTSGSVSDEALGQFMAEIGNIARYAIVTVVEADSEVKNVYPFDPKKKYAIKGRGGTAYQPAFDYFTKETEVDGVIYFGDMDCFDSEEIHKPKYPVLWAIVGDQSPPVSWGSQTKVEVNQK